MLEINLNTTLLSNMEALSCLGRKGGTSVYLVRSNKSDQFYVLKHISVPESQKQVEALIQKKLSPVWQQRLRGLNSNGGFLLLIAGSVLLALTRCPSALGAELPMLALSQQLHPALGYLYGLLLFCGMLGTSVSSLVAVLCYMEEKRPRERSRRPLWSIVLAAVTFAASLLGFGNLIGTVYPISGYCGMVFLVCLWWHDRRCCKAEKTA